jgi:ABC-type multidrug transport system ATPase subunit
MGSSGAGKTTLMDVLALRKTSGEIEGEVCLNGHPQEELSFRRCAGYVEQFDVQSAQLTIRETCDFSAKLRLESSAPEVTTESISKFVDQTLHMLELTDIQDLQVGSDESGGLSFEQRKRLSIAVELVANPSIIFLDEPTSGLVSKPEFCVAKSNF